MKKLQILKIIIGIIFILSIYAILELNIDLESGINVYHMKGENFNVSYNYGTIKVSPELNDNLVAFSFISFVGIMCFIFFVIGGGLELFKEIKEQKLK